MEGLMYCAKRSFKEESVAFDDESQPLVSEKSTLSENEVNLATTYFETMVIRHRISGSQSRDAPEQPPFCIRSKRRASDLCKFYAKQDFGEAVPELRLVRIQSRYTTGNPGSAGILTLNVTRSHFDGLLDQLQANPWVRWLISKKYDGFHQMKAQNEYADTYFFGFFHSAIVWTYLPTTAYTKVLLISRITAHYRNFYALLESYTPHLFTPYVPLVAIVLNTLLDHDNELDSYVTDIVSVERGTGFSWISSDTSELNFSVDALTRWSRVSSRVQINIINLLRHDESCMRALDTIQEALTKGSMECSNSKHKEKYDRSITELLQSIRILKMRADSFIPYATYLKNRIEAQISVIFALLTHEDSISNLKAAEASMAIAEATKRDSSAMKTIAFMTMAFLPATFLAAFFALPVLEWEHKIDVRVDGFRLYWVVAVLATTLVFVVWTLVTQRTWILNQISERRKRVDRQGKKTA